MSSDPQNAAARSRTLVVGLDVGDGPLLQRFASEGVLPHLSGLLADGIHGELGTTAEFLHVSAWPSLYTGTAPGDHGVYYTFQPRPGQQGAVRFTDDQYGVAPVWSLFDAADRPTVVFDAPYTHPVAGFRGRQIFEWGTWAHYRKPAILPGSHARATRSLLGRYPLGLEAGRVGMQALSPDELAPKLCEAIAAKGRAARRLRDVEPWAFYWVVFGETHAAAHYLWPKTTFDDRTLAPLRSVYGAWDEALGLLLEGLDEDVTVMVVSGDGVGTNRAGWHLLPQVLEHEGFACGPHGPPDSPGSPGSPGSHGSPDSQGPGGGAAAQDGPPPKAGGLFAKLRDAIPNDARQKISGLLPTAVQDALMRRKAAEALDWSRTRAFSLPTDLEGCLRVNLAGREPHGIVRPGDDYEGLLDELEQTLRSLSDPESGAAAVTRVVRTDAAAPGPRRSFLPDLVVHWSDALALDALRTPKGVEVRGPSPDPRPGTHRPHGFVAARGRGIDRGTQLLGGHVLDVAPTLLKRSGLDVPAHMGGRAWPELLDQEST